MHASLRSRLLRAAFISAAVGLLMRAMFFERADLPYAIGVMIAAFLYEALYQVAKLALEDGWPASSAAHR